MIDEENYLKKVFSLKKKVSKLLMEGLKMIFFINESLFLVIYSLQIFLEKPTQNEEVFAINKNNGYEIGNVCILILCFFE